MTSARLIALWRYQFWFSFQVAAPQDFYWEIRFFLKCPNFKANFDDIVKVLKADEKFQTFYNTVFQVI